MPKPPKVFINKAQREVIEKARSVALGDKCSVTAEEVLLDLLDVVDALNKRGSTVIKIANELEIDL